jgi:hypothetical protein
LAALAIALREALAQALGIDAEEMGLAAEPRLDALGAQTMSIFLHDKATGGAGFSVKAHERFPDLLREAEQILDCRVEGCVRGCPACVLIGELDDDQVARLDRQSALSLVRGSLLADGRPDEEDRPVAGARFSLDLLDEVRQAMEAGGTRATFRVAGPLDPSELASWRGAMLSKHWAGRGREVVLGIDCAAIEALNGAERLRLRDIVNSWGVRLEEGTVSTFDNGAHLVAEVNNANGHAILFASRDDGVCASSASWGQPFEAPIVRFEGPASWRGALVSIDRLREPAGAALRHIASDLDGSITRFGERAAAVIRTLLGTAGIADGDALTTMSYEDRYLRSPVALRLCLDTLASLVTDGAPAVPLTIRTFALEPTARPRQWLDSDWQQEDDRSAVAAAYAKFRGLKLEWRLGHPAHGRRLMLTFASGRTAEVFFDQGFGAWRNDRGSNFDFSRPPTEQTRRLAGIETGIHQAPGASTYVIVQVRN